MVGPDLLRVLEHDLSTSDLTTLLLSVASKRAAQITPARLMSGFTASRFTRPAETDPRQLTTVEQWLWGMLPDEFVGVELSPVAPLGVCSVVAAVDQNLVVSTMRGSEVVSDTTNVLALEAAAGAKPAPRPSYTSLPLNGCCERRRSPRRVSVLTSDCSHWYPARETAAAGALRQT
jgi:hypothetical protein